ncbi:MAG: hypothetical protein U1G08_08945 [Verrucomicrobiota bacterium]
MELDPSLACPVCGKPSKTSQGRAAHLRALHPEYVPPWTNSAEVITAPRLRDGNDQLTAERLRELVAGARDGVRRIIAAGLYAEKIAQELPHGQLTRWLEAHCPDVTIRSVRGWRELALGILKAIGANWKQCFRFEVPLELALLNPSLDLPENVKDTVTKIEGLISNKSARELKIQLRASEPMGGGDKIWRKWIRNNHPELIVEGRFPSRRDVSTEVRSEFRAATAKPRPIDLTNPEAKYSSFLVRKLTEDIGIATSTRILGQCPEEDLEGLRNAVGGIYQFIKRLYQSRDSARARPKPAKNRH